MGSWFCLDITNRWKTVGKRFLVDFWKRGVHLNFILGVGPVFQTHWSSKTSSNETRNKIVKKSLKLFFVIFPLEFVLRNKLCWKVLVYTKKITGFILWCLGMVSFFCVNLYFGMSVLFSMLNFRSFGFWLFCVVVVVFEGVGESTPESREDSRFWSEKVIL